MNCSIRFSALIVLACIVLATPRLLDANPRQPRFFINTAVEWHSARDDSPQQLSTTTGQIYGPTQIIALYATGKMALLFGYVDYDPKTRAFVFAPTEGFSVYRGTWKKIEGNHLQVEYRFALGGKLATPIGCKSYSDSYRARYKDPAVIATWSATSSKMEA